MPAQEPLDSHTEPAPDDHKEEEVQEPEKEQTGYSTYSYTTLPGYFLQDDADTTPETFEFMKTDFGLVQRSYDSDEDLPDRGQGLTAWQRFEHYIRSLNQAAEQKRHNDEPHTQYKLLFLGRHGNGYHNIAERYYGSEAWDCHFSALDGDPDGVMIWADAHLSREGRRQASEVHTFWESQLTQQKMSLPQAYFVSPLDRALETAEITFRGLLESAPTVVERLREGTGIHTCDRRSTVSYIRGRYPSYVTTRDPLLTETDEFWDPDLREPNDALVLRLRKLLDSIMQSGQGSQAERISFTSHSGAIGAMLRVLGHRPFSLPTGAVIPVLVKVEKNEAVLHKRHGGEAEGASHPKLAESHKDEYKQTLEQLEGPGHGEAKANDADATPQEADIKLVNDTIQVDKSTWQTIPACPADLDLENVGRQRWNMGLKEFLAGVEDGSFQLEEVAFRGRH
ncbi:histidine phosphatase superfamily [Exophiala viscosa]|uniref:Histidine phosphatase superfamily n=2 Tax=Exophiala viscosa TaxID=2486360 RepID=A0AAN6IAS2_9EURO|nr:histidine phosphatase superfamily [Exophiala viscosa]